MNRTILLASTAFFIAATPAFADGPGHKMIGFGEFGYAYSSLDDFDIHSLHARGSALWKLDGNWNVQGNFGFNTDRFDVSGSPTIAIDSWKIGGTGFWRDQSQGAFGAELYYQSLDFGLSADGFGVAARGDLYLSPQATIGGRIGYTNVGESGFDADEWAFDARGRYYAQPNLGLTLGLRYATVDADGSPDIDEWSLRGEAEYLFRDCDTSVYAGLGFGNIDGGTTFDADYWSIGLGVRLHFGTSGDLVQRHRTGTLEDLQGAMRLIP